MGKDGSLVLNVEMTALKLRRASSLASTDAAAASTLLDEAKKELHECKTSLDSLPDGTDPVVSAFYFHAAAEYHKLRGAPNAQAFYESTLSYLAHAQVEALSEKKRHDIAVDIAVAALIADEVYNFGEVNANPLMAQSLSGTGEAWLLDLLRAYQTGDIDAYNRITAANKAAIDKFPTLVAAKDKMLEKLTLLAIMELAAQRPGENGEGKGGGRRGGGGKRGAACLASPHTLLTIRSHSPTLPRHLQLTSAAYRSRRLRSTRACQTLVSSCF